MGPSPRIVAPSALLGICLHMIGAWPAEAQNVELEAPPFIPTPDRVVAAMLDLADVEAGDVVYDLGSGDGRLVIAAALRGARAIGIEYDRSLVERSRTDAGSAGIGDLVEFVHGDIFETDVRGADAVMLYLSPELNLRLRPRLLRDLDPGSRIVSHAFHMGDWRPDSTRTIGAGVTRATIHLWVVPADVDGFWSLEVEGAEPTTLELRQAYQRLTGSIWRGGDPIPVTGTVDGDSVELRLGPVGQSGNAGEAAETFRGRLLEGRIQGRVTTPERERSAAVVRFTDPARAPS